MLILIGLFAVFIGTRSLNCACSRSLGCLSGRYLTPKHGLRQRAVLFIRRDDAWTNLLRLPRNDPGRLDKKKRAARESNNVKRHAIFSALQ